MNGPLGAMFVSDSSKETITVNDNTGNTKKSRLVELKNGKVIFKQKCPSFEKMSETLQEIVNFREMLEQRFERYDPPLSVIPDEHKPLIAKMAHESDKTISALAKHIHKELCPAEDEDEESIITSASLGFPLLTVESAIKSVCSRNNYGLDGVPGVQKVPAALCIWRWEVNERYRHWLPKAAKEKAEARLVERAQAKKDLLALFQALPEDERNAMLDPKGTAKLSPSNKDNGRTTSQPLEVVDDETKTSTQLPKLKNSEESENDASENPATKIASGSGPSRPKQAADIEKTAKGKGKEEKRASKTEKERKAQEAQNRSRSIMVNFFGRAKAARAPPSAEPNASVGPSQSEFEKTFKTFASKKDANLAPVNWFADAKGKRSASYKEGEVIAIDDDGDDDIQMKDAEEVEVDVTQMNAKDRLQAVLSSLPPSADPSRLPRRSLKSRGLKTDDKSAVRTLIAELSEAEINGDTTLVRSLLTTLSNRSLLPAKVLIFSEDLRPGYFGTWTRSSRVIGPRNPFAKDVLKLDYAYDSGEEWEEEEKEDGDDVVEDGEDEEGGEEDGDSDLDSWLVDDDEVLEAVEDEIERSNEPSMPFVPTPTLKRKMVEGGDSKLGKKRKAVVPLIPFAKGPFWEESIGQCEFDSFKPYKVQFFNDTSYPIDPFNFVSTCVHERSRITPGDRPSYDVVFAVPSLPDRLCNSAALPPSIRSSSLLNAVPLAKRTASAPKTVFPEAHLPFLLTKITSLGTGNITFIVESIYQELREHNVKKNAIEAKVREVGEKCREKKVWVVKGTVLQTMPTQS